MNLLMNWSSTTRTLGHPHSFLNSGHKRAIKERSEWTNKLMMMIAVMSGERHLGNDN